jgi:hypothetical protein
MKYREPGAKTAAITECATTRRIAAAVVAVLLTVLRAVDLSTARAARP